MDKIFHELLQDNTQTQYIFVSFTTGFIQSDFCKIVMHQTGFKWVTKKNLLLSVF